MRQIPTNVSYLLVVRYLKRDFRKSMIGRKVNNTIVELELIMSEDMSMSDLLPLVATALNDKVAADAAEELATAREERDRSHRVEVIRSRANGEDEDEDGETVVYGCGLFEDGQYHHNNTNMWNIKLDKSSDNICHLVDLRDCHICVGGGFPVASLDDTLPHNSGFAGFINDNEGQLPEHVVEVSVCFSPHYTWLDFWIYGWPRDEAVQAGDLGQDEIIPFLVDNVAAQYPDALVEFKCISFVATRIHGALKRLLPPKLKKEVRADRDKRIAEEDWQEVVEFVESTMRERDKFTEDWLQAILGLFLLVGVKKRTEVNDAVIVTTITTCEQSGVFGIDNANEVLTRMAQHFRHEIIGSNDTGDR